MVVFGYCGSIGFFVTFLFLFVVLLFTDVSLSSLLVSVVRSTVLSLAVRSFWFGHYLYVMLSLLVFLSVLSQRLGFVGCQLCLSVFEISSHGSICVYHSISYCFSFIMYVLLCGHMSPFSVLVLLCHNVFQRFGGCVPLGSSFCSVCSFRRGHVSPFCFLVPLCFYLFLSLSWLIGG